MNQKQNGNAGAKPQYKKDGFKRDGFKKDGFKKDGFKKDGFRKDSFKKPVEDKKKPHIIKINTPKLPKEWLFMCKNTVEVDEIAAVIGEQNGIDTEIWKDMGILEFTMGEESRIDFERIEIEPEDEISEAYVEENNITCIYAVSIKDVAEETVTKMMKQICQEIDGFFCGDTDDFTPVIK